jgi:hypothetical protein
MKVQRRGMKTAELNDLMCCQGDRIVWLEATTGLTRLEVAVNKPVLARQLSTFIT